MLLSASALLKLLDVLVQIVEMFSLSFQLLLQGFETGISWLVTTLP